MTKFKWFSLVLIAFLSLSVHAKQCVRSGCSGELCVDASLGPVHSTCEYKEAYRCLSKSRCEVQNNGECGWTQTPSYLRCLRDMNSIKS